MSIDLLTKLAEEVDAPPFAKKEGGEEKEPVEEEESEEAEVVPEEETEAPVGGAVDPMAIMEFFAQSNPVTDADFHAFAEQNGFDVHQAEAVAYKLAQKFMMFLRGGPGAGVDPNTIDPVALDAGMQAEAQSYPDPVIQKKIVFDNLAADPEAYTAAPPEGELPMDPNEQPIDEKTASLLMKIAGQKMVIKKKGRVGSNGELEKASLLQRKPIGEAIGEVVGGTRKKRGGVLGAVKSTLVGRQNPFAGNI